MSEPSPEAKQAANWAGWHEAPTPEHHRAYCEGYDTATAKAREELERYKKLCAIQNEFGCEGKRGNFVPAHQQPSIIRRNPNEDHRAAQSNAPTAERKEGDATWTEQSQTQLPVQSSVAPKGSTPAAATTADVEIAREAVREWYLESRNWTGYDMPAHQQLRLLEIFKNVAAQVRAPLVEALEFYATENLYPNDPNCYPTLTADRGQRARAALTGTGEKR